jgi:hypothetical protein
MSSDEAKFQLFERITDSEIFANLEKTTPPSDFACLMLITQAFYQTGQDLFRNAEVIAKVLVKGSFKFRKQEMAISAEDFANFDPKKYGLALTNIMSVGHQRGGVNPRGLLFISNQEKQEMAINMALSAKENALKNYQRLLAEGTHAQRDPNSSG